MKLPQLSLRDLFWLVAMVAMGCGWWVERSRLAHDLNEVRKDAEILSVHWQSRGDFEERARIIEILQKHYPRRGLVTP